MQTHLVIIDPQNDFCNPNGSLFVPGADQDIDRLSSMVDRLVTKLDDIHITMDSHKRVDISHPIWFVDAQGNHPPPFTLISSADLISGRWRTYLPGLHARTLAYLQALEARGRYGHTIWPEHCIIGDEGQNIAPKLSASIHQWEDRFAAPEIITKGSNPYTEHFSAVQAEVPDPEDPSTQVNTSFISTLEQADIILLAGQALSHCVANTVMDIADNFSDPKYIKKLVLLTDATSEVPNPPNMTIFSDFTAKFLADMQAKGMKLSTTTDVLT